MGKFLLFLVLVLLLANLAYAQTSETVTVTTYYPAPYGSYREVQWGNFPNSRGYLKQDQGASIELGGSGTPYIDFSNDMASDFDARMTLLNDNELGVQVGNRLRVRDKANSGYRDVDCRYVIISNGP